MNLKMLKNQIHLRYHLFPNYHPIQNLLKNLRYPKLLKNHLYPMSLKNHQNRLILKMLKNH
jgi:hypothetical protein